MGDQVNIFLDNLDALLWRLMQMPLALQLLLWLLISGTFWILFLLILGRKVIGLDHKARVIFFSAAMLCSMIIAGAVLFDNQWKHKEQEAELRMSPPVMTTTQETGPSAVLPKEVQRLTIKTRDTAVKKEVMYATSGCQVIRLRFSSPEAVAYVATIDLTQYEAVLDTHILVKEKTSAFGSRFKAEVAVNGEAGETPGLKAPLGQWTGNYMVNGVPLLMKDTDKRPFVYFDQKGRAFYSPDREVITIPAENMFQAIWGRFDLLQEGKVQIDPRDGTKNNSYPRTIVGIDESGWKAYLMVVDGRKPGHSLGLTMEECGQILLGFGAWSAMACDQGGSSCMYVVNQGIISRPADGGERPVYTHLGFRKKF